MNYMQGHDELGVKGGVEVNNVGACALDDDAAVATSTVGDDPKPEEAAGRAGMAPDDSDNVPVSSYNVDAKEE